MSNVVDLKTSSQAVNRSLESKLKHYSSKYGEWIFAMSSKEAYDKASHFKALSKLPGAPNEVLDYSCRAILYECIA